MAVVGGGLAALSAAWQAARLGLRCTAYCGAAPGGLLLSIESIQGLPGHPQGIAGYDLGPMMQEAALDAGATCAPDEADALQAVGDDWILRSAGAALRARTVVLAPGCRLRALGVAGEERLMGKGVSHCASCDAPLLRGREVAVVGGGDAACQEALTLAAHAGRVHLLVRTAALKAQQVWRARIAAQPRIVPRYGTRVAQILGDAAVTGVRLAGGDELAVHGVFVYAGLVPNTAWLAEAMPLATGGHIAVGMGLHTPTRGLLAAGSAREGNCGQAAGAAADGIAAAWFAEHRPGVRTEIVKPRESWVDDPAMRAKVVREADAAIFAVGL